MSTRATPHIVLIGTGLTSLTIARTLLLSTTLTTPFSLTLLDKAKNPGGRLTSRTYDSGVVLETGARVFEASPNPSTFIKEVERWESKGYVKQVVPGMLKGVGEGSSGSGRGGKWWEGVGGFSRGLIAGLVQEIKEASKGRVEFKYEVTVSGGYLQVVAANPTPIDPTTNPLDLTLDPSIELPPISYLVHTGPSPQSSVLLPSSSTARASPTTYLKTFVWLLPTIKLSPPSPIYHRNPHTSINSIATGLGSKSPSSKTDDDAQGLVIQSTPEKLGLGCTKDETTDQEIRNRFFKILSDENVLPLEILSDIKDRTGRESQIKRWKFAQVEGAVEVRQGGYETEGKRCVVLEGDRVILAGDGTVGGAGCVEGAYLAGVEAAQVLIRWVEQAERSKM
ncbi:BQ5605_C012g06920 [Microbotryum silenes-dioicae]|uniref:BQ5605_C012g06920 protein n=1 Tax=Microbotryum silenes-dioicae TaxID=796604 RepID=A0A2X0NVF5_9BASI|nr:BQ5605_C012g06920 [Microbotryum silenes-dioicae]